MTQTCQAIVQAVIGLGIEEADRKRTWMAGACRLSTPMSLSFFFPFPVVKTAFAILSSGLSNYQPCFRQNVNSGRLCQGLSDSIQLTLGTKSSDILSLELCPCQRQQCDFLAAISFTGFLCESQDSLPSSLNSCIADRRCCAVGAHLR
jgi:hypothetical protein